MGTVPENVDILWRHLCTLFIDPMEGIVPLWGANPHRKNGGGKGMCVTGVRGHLSCNRGLVGVCVEYPEGGPVRRRLVPNPENKLFMTRLGKFGGGVGGVSLQVPFPG